MNPIDVVKDAFSAVEARDWQKANSLFADDFTFVGAMPGQIGRKEFVEMDRSLLTAFPDLKFNLSGLKADGNRVTGTTQITGTHTGTLNLPAVGVYSYAATQKKIRLPQEPMIFTVRDDHIYRCEVTQVAGGGVSGILSQLGIMSPIDLVRGLYMAIENKDWKKIDQLVTDDLSFTGPVPSQYTRTDFVNFHRALLAGIPDWKFNASNYKYDGTHVTCTVQISGTHTGTLDLPLLDVHKVIATNKKFRLPQETLTYTFHDNRIYKMDVSMVPGGGLDGILSQLGIHVEQRVGLPW